MGAVSPVRIIQYGLGSIGLGIAEIALERGYRIVGAVDIDPAKAGRRLADLLPNGPTDVVVTSSPKTLLNAGADIVLHSTQSRIAQVLPQQMSLLDAGLDVISTCEELAFPWHHHPREAATLDELAKARDATVIALGVNPGFVMDLLPLILTAPCQRVDRIIVVRVVDLGVRRLPLQQKVGVSLRAEAFQHGVAEGRFGHVGLPQSVAMIAHALGWVLEAFDESIEPTLDSNGVVQGLHQVCRGMREGKEVISLDLTMAVDAGNPHDAVRIDGIPPIQMVLHGGIHGDQATCAIVVNSIPQVLAAPPGLLTAIDLLPLRSSV